MSNGRRTRASSSRFRDPGDQIVERVALLEIAQARGVWRGNVDRQIIGVRGENLHALDIGGGAIFRVLVGAEIGADDRAPLCAGEPPGGELKPVVVETHPVDDGGVLVQPKKPRLRVADLRPRRHGAGLEEGEAEARETANRLEALVEAGRKPERMRKFEPERVDLEALVGRVLADWQQAREF